MKGDTVEGCGTGNMVMSAGQAVSIIKALYIYLHSCLAITPLQPRCYCVCPKWLHVL